MPSSWLHFDDPDLVFKVGIKLTMLEWETCWLVNMIYRHQAGWFNYSLMSWFCGKALQAPRKGMDPVVLGHCIYLVEFPPFFIRKTTFWLPLSFPKDPPPPPPPHTHLPPNPNLASQNGTVPPTHYENVPIQIYWTFYHQKKIITFR